MDSVAAAREYRQAFPLPPISLASVVSTGAGPLAAIARLHLEQERELSGAARSSVTWISRRARLEQVLAYPDLDLESRLTALYLAGEKVGGDGRHVWLRGLIDQMEDGLGPQLPPIWHRLPLRLRSMVVGATCDAPLADDLEARLQRLLQATSGASDRLWWLVQGDRAGLANLRHDVRLLIDLRSQCVAQADVGEERTRWLQYLDQKLLNLTMGEAGPGVGRKAERLAVFHVTASYLLASLGIDGARRHLDSRKSDGSFRWGEPGRSIVLCLLAIRTGDDPAVARHLDDLAALEVDTTRAERWLQIHFNLARGRVEVAHRILARIDPGGAFGDLHACWYRIGMLLNDQVMLAHHRQQLLDRGAGYCFRELSAFPDISAAVWAAGAEALHWQAVHLGPVAAAPQAVRPVAAVNAVPDALVGGSAAMRDLRTTIAVLADRPEPVLIEAETGCGKELVARALHERSIRADQPLVIINCAALTDSLGEAELFGHVRGAFTGAERDRDGAFAAAGKGTIVLDEIGSLSLQVQGALLRVLETGDYMPLGSGKVRRSTARIVAVSNEDLEQTVSRGAFRADLLYRLRRLLIGIPPLRDRLDDLDDLYRHFAALIGIVPPPVLDDGLRAAWTGHDWPGNVREFRNQVERILIMPAGTAWAIGPARGGLKGPVRPAAAEPAAEPPAVAPPLARIPGPPRVRTRRARVLSLLLRDGAVTRRSVMLENACAPATAAADLDALVAVGLLRLVDEGGPNQRHFVAAAPAAPA